MRPFRPESLIDGSLDDPSSRYLCHVFTPEIAAAAIAPEIGASVVADAAIPAAIDAGAVLGGAGETALLGGAGLAPGLTVAPELAGGALSAADLGIAGGALDAGVGAASGLDAALGGLTGVGGDVAGGAAGLVPGGALTTGVTTAPTLAAPALSAGTAVGGPVAAAPALPATVGDVAPTVSGDLAAMDPAAGVPSATTGGSATTLGDWSPLSGAGSSGTGTTAGTTAAGTASKGGFFDRAISSLTGGALNKSDLGTILSGGGLAMNLFKGNQSLPGEKQLSGAASNLSATAAGQAALGSQLESFLQSGKLPPGVEMGLRSATQAATASIKAAHAARGTSGSSAEASEIQAANDRALAAGQQVALQLLQQGATMVGQAVNTEGLAAQLYQEILGNALQKDQAFGQAIGNFASSLARSDTQQPANITITQAAA